MGADVENKIAALYEAAVEPIHGSRTSPMAVINAQRSDDAARSPKAFEHGRFRVRPDGDAALPPRSRWREAPTHTAQQAARSPRASGLFRCARRCCRPPAMP